MAPAALVALAMAVAVPEPAAAEPDQPSDAFVTRLDFEIPLLVAGVAFWTLPVIIDTEDRRRHCEPCDPVHVNAFDRKFIGYDSEAADITSDVLAAVLPIGLSATSVLLDRDRPGEAAQDLLIIFESMVLAGVTNQLFRHVYVRPRPYMYLDPLPEDRHDGPEDWRSFFSGHTAQAFAASSAFASIYAARRPGSRAIPWVWAGTMTAATLMPVARVASGEHFPTDVFAGAAFGLSIGLIVPALHRRNRAKSATRLVVGPGSVGVHSSW